MAETYFEDYEDALETLSEDGFAVNLIKKGTTGDPWEVDENGDPVGSTPDEIFPGFGITTRFSAYYRANGISRAGDAMLIFAPSEMSQDYIDFYATLSGDGSDKAFAEIDGEEWRVIGGEEVKPTSTQVIAKFHLRK